MAVVSSCMEKKKKKKKTFKKANKLSGVHSTDRKSSLKVTLTEHYCSKAVTLSDFTPPESTREQNFIRLSYASLNKAR